MPPQHIPVLLNEVIEALALSPGDSVIDGTVGAGGHAAAILDKTSPDGKLIGFDVDEVALEAARRNLARFGSRAMLVRENYKNASRVLHTQAFGPAQAALLDLGFSSMEIDDPGRGLSFRFDGPLDMRYDSRTETSAADIVNSWSRDEISKVIWDYGEERYSRQIAEAIVRARRDHPITGTFQLVDIIAGAVPGHYRHGRLHFATRTFQALRIAVNDELGGLQGALAAFIEALAPGGRFAVISFHSLEDRIVKHYFREQADEGKITVKTKRPIEASEEEVAANPRSRSAKLRIIIKN